MTPEIDKLKLAWEDAKRQTAFAADAERRARDLLDEKVVSWATAELKSQGIELGVTPVEGFRYRPREGYPPHYERANNAVVRVAARDGAPIYMVQKLTKTGALSKAANAADGHYLGVRKVAAQ